MLLRKKAAEELKKEQEQKSAERRKVIDQRCGQSKKAEGLGEGKFIDLKFSFLEEWYCCSAWMISITLP